MNKPPIDRKRGILDWVWYSSQKEWLPQMDPKYLTKNNLW